MRFRHPVGLFCACSLTVLLSAGCGAESANTVTTTVAPKPVRKTIDLSAPVEKVVIEVDANRAGHSLMVKVTGIGRGHGPQGPMENSDLWQVRASYGQSPLRQVLAGPAKVSRAPTGKALGDQWNVEVNFLIGFALPDRAGKVTIFVQEPGGETKTHEIEVEAPEQRLSLSE